MSETKTDPKVIPPELRKRELHADPDIRARYYAELLRTMGRAKSEQYGIPLSALGVLVANTFCSDQTEAKILIRHIEKEWGLYE